MQEVSDAMADPAFMALYKQYKLWPQYAAVLDDLIRYHEEKLKVSRKKKRRKRRQSMQTTLFRDTVRADDDKSVYRYTNRNKRVSVVERVRREASTEITKAAECLDRIANHCLAHDPDRICLVGVADAHRVYHARSASDKKQWLLDIVSQNESDAGYIVDATDSDGATHRFRLCNYCFSSFHGFGRSTLQRRVAQFRSGVRRPVPTVREGVQSTHKRMICYSWILDKTVSYGDYMPDELSVVLPVYTKKELYLWFTTSNESKADLVSYQRFSAILKVDFPFVQFRSHKKFTQCRVCNLFDNRIMKATVTFPLHWHLVSYVVLVRIR